MSIARSPGSAARHVAIGWALGRGAAVWRAAGRLAHERAGVTSLEYAIMGSLICAAIAASVVGFAGGLGGNMSGTFSRLAASM